MCFYKQSISTFKTPYQLPGLDPMMLDQGLSTCDRNQKELPTCHRTAFEQAYSIPVIDLASMPWFRTNTGPPIWNWKSIAFNLHSHLLFWKLDKTGLVLFLHLFCILCYSCPSCPQNFLTCTGLCVAFQARPILSDQADRPESKARRQKGYRIRRAVAIHCNHSGSYWRSYWASMHHTFVKFLIWLVRTDLTLYDFLVFVHFFLASIGRCQPRVQGQPAPWTARTVPQQR